ncbi:MAG: transglycosylase domain-containing protein, partial [Actinomycetota bacterium]|nr:transglycosylase domain-containing protein [Actinomycetota bacterium]
MPLPRLALRLVGAVVSCLVVSTLLVVLFASLALAIDWDIPESAQLYGPSTVLDRQGRGITRFAAEVDLTPVPLARISPGLQHAVVATEDRRFFEHQGVDPLSVLRAVWNNVRYGGIREGGSTLTQQYVRNVFVGSDRTLYRKIREALVAMQLEKERSKEQILEAYLNRVYFGEGAYGAEAAALTYFDKPAADLTVGESALLASVLVSPSRLSPRLHPQGAIERRNIVIDEMVRAGLLAEYQAAAARAEPITLVQRQPFEQLPAAPHFVEEVRRQMLETHGPDAVYRGGLTITTSLNLDTQFALERQVADQLPSSPIYDAGVAAVVPSSGDVVAAWGGRDFRASQVDLALNRDYGRQSGSTFKVFSLATALEEGMTLQTRYGAPSGIRIADWSVRGGGCGGRCTLLEGITRSVNTVFAQVGRDVGVVDFTTMARRLGVRSAMRDNDLTQVLGTSEVTPLDMASAFATFANDGVACPARVVVDVRRPDGTQLPPPDPRQPSAEERAAWAARLREQGYDFGQEELGRCYRAVAPSLARQVNQALEQVVARGTGRNAQIGRPQAGKTGTTSDNTEAWFVGYTPQLSIGVAFFAPGGRVPLVGVPGCRGACQGGQIPARIWA